MKRNLVTVVPAVVFVLGLSGLAPAQTADDIVEKHLAAIGGREALGKLTSRALTGTVTFSSPAGEFSGSVESYVKAPNKSRMHMQVDLSAVGGGTIEVDQRFDGTTGYMVNTMQGNSEITGNQLDNLRNNVFPSGLLNYKGAGTKVEVLPQETIDAKDMIVLSITPKSGSVMKMFLDAQSYLPMRAVTTVEVPQTGAVQQTTELSDYRAVDGVKVPFQLRISNPAQSFVIKVNKIEHNTVDDAMFVR